MDKDFGPVLLLKVDQLGVRVQVSEKQARCSLCSAVDVNECNIDCVDDMMYITKEQYLTTKKVFSEEQMGALIEWIASQEHKLDCSISFDEHIKITIDEFASHLVNEYREYQFLFIDKNGVRVKSDEFVDCYHCKFIGACRVRRNYDGKAAFGFKESLCENGSYYLRDEIIHRLMRDENVSEDIKNFVSYKVKDDAIIDYVEDYVQKYLEKYKAEKSFKILDRAECLALDIETYNQAMELQWKEDKVKKNLSGDLSVCKHCGRKFSMCCICDPAEKRFQNMIDEVREVSENNNK